MEGPSHGLGGVKVVGGKGDGKLEELERGWVRREL